MTTKVKESLSTARASIAGLIDKPATQKELDGCVDALEEIATAVRRLPSLSLGDQEDAVQIMGVALLNIRNIIKRRPK